MVRKALLKLCHEDTDVLKFPNRRTMDPNPCFRSLTDDFCKVSPPVSAQTKGEPGFRMEAGGQKQDAFPDANDEELDRSHERKGRFVIAGSAYVHNFENKRKQWS